MKQFFKFVFASMLGVFLSTIIFFFVAIAIMAAIISAASSDKAVEISENSILRVSLNYAIKERTDRSPFNNVSLPSMNSEKYIGLDEILLRIDAAKNDNRIKGIVLDMDGIGASFATLQEIRDALLKFKESKKFILAYSEGYSMKGYYLASTADKVYLNPEGSVDFRGMAAQLPFFKGTLEKLGIEAQVVKVGTYKSAVEPFILDKMSPANKEQVNSYLNSLYDYYLGNVSKSRNIPMDSLRNIADNYSGRDAEKALNAKLVDGLKYKNEIIDELKVKLCIDKKKKIKSINIEDYTSPKTEENGSQNRLAVVYAVGDIVSGEGSDEQIGSERISRAIRTVREDDKVKAVVLRINSPGGSSLASDVIWKEVELTKKVKPIIVSMGDVAASGGYYIACAADSIFAQPNTITGSIGVFGIIPNLQNFFNNKLGITFDEVKTGKYADLMSVNRPLTADERDLIQQEVNKTYDTFTKKVANGRKISQSQVDSIGQGRVWTGAQAAKIGLVDRLASFNEAITAAARKAKLKDYKLVSYPAMKDPLEAFLGSSSDKLKTWIMKKEMNEGYLLYEQAKQVMQQSGIQARLPYMINIH
ncbi:MULTISPECIES: signal peptide peptidase SppA [Olivibacter]|uniref:Signal peptide peptidase SppA n=1 Tax=Olivibacter oleidegradans TaxID=760123 RepID=A0ABV6HLI4_9SPHI|nr:MULTISPECIES: signal peptide peptidase SppA [Olivibacter]MDM8175753.1 signal peptide peptidase SppA [Olivibacter sp. 47]QEL02486.1 signal peptide peptidase SppA [Olivibacter sp. LS-1]